MAGFLLVLAPGFLYAGEEPTTRWRKVVSTDRVEGYVDTQAWKRSNLKAEVSVKWILANPERIETTSGTESYVISKESSTYDCVKRTVATRQIAKYADPKETPRLQTLEEVVIRPKPSPVTPETEEEKILEFVCFTPLPSTPPAAK
jgi:hypothetical protein